MNVIDCQVKLEMLMKYPSKKKVFLEYFNFCFFNLCVVCFYICISWRFPLYGARGVFLSPPSPVSMILITIFFVLFCRYGASYVIKITLSAFPHPTQAMGILYGRPTS